MLKKKTGHLQSVLGQRDYSPDVELWVNLPPTGQLDFGTVEEGITDYVSTRFLSGLVLSEVME